MPKFTECLASTSELTEELDQVFPKCYARVSEASRLSSIGKDGNIQAPLLLQAEAVSAETAFAQAFIHNASASYQDARSSATSQFCSDELRPKAKADAPLFTLHPHRL